MNQISLKELTYKLLNILAKGLSLAESSSWNSFARLQHLQEVNITSDLFSLREDILNYQEKLHFYVDQESYHNDISLTNKFFTNVVSTIRSRAEKSLNILIRTSNNTKDNISKQQLLEDIRLLKETTNFYLETIRTILENDEKIQKYIGAFGIDFVEKYNLSNL